MSCIVALCLVLWHNVLYCGTMSCIVAQLSELVARRKSTRVSKIYCGKCIDAQNKKNRSQLEALYRQIMDQSA